MSVDHSHDSDPIEQLLLTAYPNPERKGCPGRLVLESLANQERDQSDPNWYHVWHCSPCFAEFKELRDTRWERERSQARRRSRAIWGVVAAVACLAAILVFWSVRSHREHTPALVAQVTINLFDDEVQRGASQDTKIELPPFPRAVDDVHIILTRFSEAGIYTVALLRSKESGSSALAVAKSQTVADGPQLELNVRLNLLNAPVGNYSLGTRLDDGNLVYYYPLRIE
jgi:hypothetical protein